MSTYQVVIQESLLLLIDICILVTVLELFIKLPQVRLAHVHILIDSGHQTVCHFHYLSQNSHGLLVHLYALHLLAYLGLVICIFTCVEALVRHDVLYRDSRVLHQTIKISSHHRGFL